MMLANRELRSYAKAHRVALRDIADVAGVDRGEFFHSLKEELPSHETAHLCRVVERIAQYKADRRQREAESRSERRC